MRPGSFLVLIGGLLIVLLVCIVGIIYLAGAVDARPIPDVLVAVPTGILGILGGLMLPRPGDVPPSS